ncbi:MAG: CBS domain-containing protein [Deltaproteobacteria bacterium]|nr:CBS domain-containing protein [Deltaproteobacteria bacterium]
MFEKISKFFSFVRGNPTCEDLSPYQARMIERFEAFNKKSLASLMTPQDKIFSLDIESACQDVLEDVKSSGYSRIPLYKDDKKNLVGIVYAKDLLNACFVEDFKHKKLSQLLRVALLLKPNQSAHEALSRLQQERKHIALIVFEGKSVGLITMEDLLEELVGEIKDERDIIEKNQEI